MKTVLCVGSYLLAVITANCLVSAYGQMALPFTAFLLIPFDLAARDILHERWKGHHLWGKMFLLVATGSILSYVTAMASAQVCLASAVSFFVTGLVDTLSYHLLDNKPRLVKMNGSNLVSAVVDSVLFPLLAFGSFVPMLSLAQSASKFLGGLIWSAVLILVFRRKKSHATDYKTA